MQNHFLKKQFQAALKKIAKIEKEQRRALDNIAIAVQKKSLDKIREDINGGN